MLAGRALKQFYWAVTHYNVHVSVCWQELKGGLKDYGETFNYFLMVA